MPRCAKRYIGTLVAASRGVKFRDRVGQGLMAWSARQRGDLARRKSAAAAVKRRDRGMSSEVYSPSTSKLENDEFSGTVFETSFSDHGESLFNRGEKHPCPRCCNTTFS